MIELLRQKERVEGVQVEILFFFLLFLRLRGLFLRFCWTTNENGFLKVVWKKRKSTTVRGDAQEHLITRDWSLHYDDPNSRNPRTGVRNRPSNILTVLMKTHVYTLMCVHTCTYVQIISWDMSSIKTPAPFSFSFSLCNVNSCSK